LSIRGTDATAPRSTAGGGGIVAPVPPERAPRSPVVGGKSDVPRAVVFAFGAETSRVPGAGDCHPTATSRRYRDAPSACARVSRGRSRLDRVASRAFCAQRANGARESSRTGTKKTCVVGGKRRIVTRSRKPPFDRSDRSLHRETPLETRLTRTDENARSKTPRGVHARHVPCGAFGSPSLSIARARPGDGRRSRDMPAGGPRVRPRESQSSPTRRIGVRAPRRRRPARGAASRFPSILIALVFFRRPRGRLLGPVGATRRAARYP
jgi:hypothetical protein